MQVAESFLQIIRL